MQAVVLESHGGPEVLTLREVPDPVPGPEEVLVEVVGTALVDARIATASVIRTADPLLRSLSARGEVREEQVNDVGGWSVNTGKVEVMGVDLRIARADGTPHPRRHALGAFTNRPAAGTFARPRTNAASFRQHDVVARSILQRLPALADASASRPVATS